MSSDKCFNKLQIFAKPWPRPSQMRKGNSNLHAPISVPGSCRIKGPGPRDPTQSPTDVTQLAAEVPCQSEKSNWELWDEEDACEIKPRGALAAPRTLEICVTALKLAGGRKLVAASR